MRVFYRRALGGVFCVHRRHRSRGPCGSADLQGEPVIAVIIPQYEGAVGWMTLEQLTDALAGIEFAHHFILMHLMQTRFEGLKQYFYDFGLFFGELVSWSPTTAERKPELKT